MLRHARLLMQAFMMTPHEGAQAVCVRTLRFDRKRQGVASKGGLCAHAGAAAKKVS